MSIDICKNFLSWQIIKSSYVSYAATKFGTGTFSFRAPIPHFLPHASQFLLQTLSAYHNLLLPTNFYSNFLFKNVCLNLP